MREGIRKPSGRTSRVAGLCLSSLLFLACTRGEGGPCEFDSDCDTGLVCVGGAPRGKCQQPDEDMTDPGDGDMGDAGTGDAGDGGPGPDGGGGLDDGGARDGGAGDAATPDEDAGD